MVYKFEGVSDESLKSLWLLPFSKVRLRAFKCLISEF